jgi:hypothetical protein
MVEKDPIFLQYRDKINQLELTVFDEKGKKLDFSHIELRDYHDDLGDEGYEIYLYV